jgi:Uncharacterized conserved protein
MVYLFYPQGGDMPRYGGSMSDTWDFYQDKKGEWRWRRTATNKNIVGAASEGYKNKADATLNAEHYGYNGKFNPAGKWEFYQDKKGEWRWRHTAVNGKVIGRSTEGYTAKPNCMSNAKLLGYKE